MNKKNIILIALSAILLSGCTSQNNDKQNTKSDKQSDINNVKVSKETEAPDKYDGMNKDVYEPGAYQRFFTEAYDEFRIDDLAKWKDDKGDWRYPEGYKLVCNPGNASIGTDTIMASQQLPEELLKDMSTSELFDFILNAPGDMSITVYDDYMVALSTYRSFYNFIDNLMERNDIAEVVHKHYQTYPEGDVLLLSKENRHNADDIKKQEQFQLTEALELFYTGKLSAD